VTGRFQVHAEAVRYILASWAVMQKRQKRFDRSYESLEAVFRFVGDFLAECRADEDTAFSINLAVEELFTNMVKFNKGTSDRISVGIGLGDSQVVLELVDHDVEPFEPDPERDPAVDRPIEDRQIGGLGIHLVKSVVDEITYKYGNRMMTVTVVKNLER